jgi:hypothetical protein
MNGIPKKYFPIKYGTLKLLLLLLSLVAIGFLAKWSLFSRKDKIIFFAWGFSFWALSLAVLKSRPWKEWLTQWWSANIRGYYVWCWLGEDGKLQSHSGPFFTARPILCRPAMTIFLLRIGGFTLSEVLMTSEESKIPAWVASRLWSIRHWRLTPDTDLSKFQILSSGFGRILSF